jgi:phospholipid-binding lipoprotein MlaA
MFPNPRCRTPLLPLLCAALLVTGCVAVPERDPRDPFESFNRTVYRFNDAADRVVLAPAARVYKAVTPAPVRTGVRNFFQNLALPVDIGNDLLQAKPVAAARDTARLLMNTVIGMGGLFDVASSVGLDDPDEDFGQTLGRWGVGSGPYLMLPFLGPTTVRGGLGEYGLDNNYLDPTRNHKPEHERYNAKAVDLVQRRTDLLGQGALLRESFDPYAFLRDAYLQRRAFLVHDGAPPVDPEVDPYALPEDEEPTPPPSEDSTDSPEGEHTLDVG